MQFLCLSKIMNEMIIANLIVFFASIIVAIIYYHKFQIEKTKRQFAEKKNELYEEQRKETRNEVLEIKDRLEKMKTEHLKNKNQGGFFGFIGGLMDNVDFSKLKGAKGIESLTDNELEQEITKAVKNDQYDLMGALVEEQQKREKNK